VTHLVFNERVKLLASTLNVTGIAIIVTGAVAPAVGALYGTLGNAGHGSAVVAAAGGIGLFRGWRRPTCFGTLCAWDAAR